MSPRGGSRKQKPTISKGALDVAAKAAALAVKGTRPHDRGVSVGIGVWVDWDAKTAALAVAAPEPAGEVIDVTPEKDTQTRE